MMQLHRLHGRAFAIQRCRLPHGAEEQPNGSERLLTLVLRKRDELAGNTRRRPRRAYIFQASV